MKETDKTNVRVRRHQVKKRVLNILFGRVRAMSASEFFRENNYGVRESIYSALRSLEREGLITSRIEPRRLGSKGSLRKMYFLNKQGIELVTKIHAPLKPAILNS